MIELLKRLNASYIPPSRDRLSSILLENEVVHVNIKIDQIIENNQNLTLGIIFFFKKNLKNEFFNLLNILILLLLIIHLFILYII